MGEWEEGIRCNELSSKSRALSGRVINVTLCGPQKPLFNSSIIRKPLNLNEG